MDVWTFPIILVAFTKPCKKLTILFLFSQPWSGCVQAPSNFLISKDACSPLWISNQLVTITNSYISANYRTILSLKASSRMFLEWIILSSRKNKSCPYSLWPISNLFGTYDLLVSSFDCMEVEGSSSADHTSYTYVFMKIYVHIYMFITHERAYINMHITCLA